VSAGASGSLVRDQRRIGCCPIRQQQCLAEVQAVRSNDMDEEGRHMVVDALCLLVREREPAKFPRLALR
jgi:hypothetical protein